MCLRRFGNVAPHHTTESHLPYLQKKGSKDGSKEKGGAEPKTDKKGKKTSEVR